MEAAGSASRRTTEEHFRTNLTSGIQSILLREKTQRGLTSSTKRAHEAAKSPNDSLAVWTQFSYADLRSSPIATVTAAWHYRLLQNPFLHVWSAFSIPAEFPSTACGHRTADNR